MSAFTPKNMIIFKAVLNCLKSLIDFADNNLIATYIIGSKENNNKYNTVYLYSVE